MAYHDSLPSESDELPVFFGADYHPGDFAECFSHFVVAVGNLTRSENWYRDIVGADLLGRGLTAEPLPHSVLKMNTGQLIILVETDVDSDRQAGHGVHHGFLLTRNQFRRAMERLQKNNIEIVAQREEFNAKGQYSVDVFDPDGNHYQLETVDPTQATDTVPSGAGVIDCGPAADYNIGEVRLFKDATFFLVRNKEGFLAMSRWCTHMNGLLTYQQAHWRFVCPMHRASYDRRGIPNCSTLRHPNLSPMRLHPISFTADGHVLVNTDETIERNSYEPEQAAELAAAK